MEIIERMIQTVFQKLRRLTSAPVLLGRWCRTDKKLNDIKVDLANVDHCGTCVHEKIKNTKSIPNHFITNSTEIKKSSL
jgi:hypothetical protein